MKLAHDDDEGCGRSVRLQGLGAAWVSDAVAEEQKKF
jgi:hypothetical protein